MANRGRYNRIFKGYTMSKLTRQELGLSRAEFRKFQKCINTMNEYCSMLIKASQSPESQLSFGQLNGLWTYFIKKEVYPKIPNVDDRVKKRFLGVFKIKYDSRPIQEI